MAVEGKGPGAGALRSAAGELAGPLRERWARAILAALTGVVAFGTLGYMVIERWSWFDALYMTVITLATIGYGEVRPLSDAGRGFTIVLVILGLSVVTYVISSLNQHFFEHWFGEVFWRSRVSSRIEKVSGHYILCGCGRVGHLVRREFEDAGVPFVVIESNPVHARRLAGEGVLVVEGDATEEKTLDQAGIVRAAGLVTTLPDDAGNVYVSMTARGMNPSLVIVARASDESIESKLRKAGANRIISPNAMGGRMMARALLMPEVMDFLQIATSRGNVDLQIEQFSVGAAEEGAVRAGTTVGRMREMHRVAVIAIRKRTGDLFEMPAPETLIENGDTLIVIGRPEHCRVVAGRAKSA